MLACGWAEGQPEARRAGGLPGLPLRREARRFGKLASAQD
jgi:hypothetical protein